VDLTPGSISVAVDRLENRGLVKRKPGSDDRRVHMVHLTPAGQTVIRKAFTQHEAEMERLFSNLSCQERCTLITLLKKLGKDVESRAENESVEASSARASIRSG
jgi:MarR family 2-MHQ and catechol resistance regulon transcriptional repressor